MDFGGCVLLTAEGELLPATVRGRLMGPRKALGNAVVVGDQVGLRREAARAVVDEVQLRREAARAVVDEVQPRRNAFSRRAAGEPPQEQVVAANLDQVVLVTSLAQPDFSAGLADRVLAQAEHAGIPARLVLNKTDLGDPPAARALLTEYERADVPCHAISATRGSGLEVLRHALLGRRSLFVGHSGVGKSTLLNALVPGLELLEGAVNEKTGRGRHTTTAAILVRPEPGFELIDTPGVRGFGLWGVGSRDLEQAYTEFRRYLGLCRFSDCRHDTEPGCALHAALEVGEISRLRFESFLKLRAELEEEEGPAESRTRRTKA